MRVLSGLNRLRIGNNGWLAGLNMIVNLGEQLSDCWPVQGSVRFRLLVRAPTC
jgi:hypothetical protein